MGTENQVNSSNFATITVPAFRSMPSVAQIPSPKYISSVCSACGRDFEAFHRLKHDGTARNFCSTCILLRYKGMYCCLCFLVYETPAAKADLSLWVSCAKCQRICHVKCARDRDLPVDSMFFTCNKCFQLEKTLINGSCISKEGQTGNESVPQKRMRVEVDHQSESVPPLDDQQVTQAPPAEEVLAAAKIVALLAVQQAKDAKARARATAAAAVRAAACAKAALDTAYRVAQDEARWKPESSRCASGVFPGNHRALPSPTGLNLAKFTRAGAPLASPRLYLTSSSYKEQVAKDQKAIGYCPPKSRFSTQYHRMNNSSSNGAVSKSGAIQKPQAPCDKGTSENVQTGGPSVEPEVVIVSASPASVLDAASSLDNPKINSSVEPGVSHSTASSSLTVLARSVVSADSSNLQEKLSSSDKGHERSNLVPPFAVELTDSKNSSAPSSVTDMEVTESGPNFAGKEKAAEGVV